MKEQTLATTSAESMPKNLRHLVSIVPEATWNGYNVWVKSKDKTRMKSLGFSYSKNGKHAGQWFTNERAQNSLVKKQAQSDKKSPAPAKSQPKTAPEKTAPENSTEPNEICCVAKFDKVYNTRTSKDNYLIFRAKNCTGINQIISWFLKDPVKNLACKGVENLSIETFAKVYKTDGTFLAAARKKFNIPPNQKVYTLDFTPKESLPHQMGTEDCAIVEWDDPKTKKHMVNLFRIKNGTVTDFRKHALQKIQKKTKRCENLTITQTRYYDTDQKFIRAFERNNKGKDFLRVVQSIDMAAA